MCGIAGLISPNGRNASRHVETMCSHIQHRGPDASDMWSEGSITLGHRRLSIVDLSPAGAQPMHSHCGRYVASFNGEIYNFQALRAELDKRNGEIPWRGRSDTEVLLACISVYSIDGFLPRLEGVFALAIWDRQEHTLLLARDCMGEKPLYYGFVGDTFAFSSELKAFHDLPGWSRRISRSALQEYFRYGYVPAPHSMYEGMHKLLPGHSLLLSMDDAARKSLPTSKAFWRLDDAIQRGAATPFLGSPTEAIELLDHRLGDVISRQMIADVPIGAFLSGGIDSSTTVAIMQKHSNRPVRTFTIGFVDEEFNEARHAKAVAQHLGTEHTELYVTPDEAMVVVPKLPWIYDEPFADSSQIPTFLVSQLARQHVTVSLSGDGGDELFGGYNRYEWADKLWRNLSWAPVAIRRHVGSVMRAIPEKAVAAGYSAIRPALPRGLRFSNPADKWTKAIELFALQDHEQLYRRLISQWVKPEEVVKGAHPVQPLFSFADDANRGLSFKAQMMRLDALTYLPDDILVKVDRASMAVSLESRVPMLDKSIVELAWQLPESLKFRDGISKWILRQVLYQYVPAKLVERPKMGFGVPLESWLRGPLRDWAAALLDPARIASDGYLQAEPIQRAWQEHQAGTRNWHYQLWVVLMFQAWLETQKK